MEVPLDAPMRRILPPEIAQRVVEVLCREGEDSPSMPVSREIWLDRDVMIAEIACSLRKSERLVRTALRRKDEKITAPESPWPFTGYEYLGAFRVEQGLIIADRCYVDRDKPLLAVRTPAVAGTWHAYLRFDPHFEGRTVGLLVVHADHFDVAKAHGEHLGMFGVDAGSAVVVDQRVLQDPALVHALTETSDWDEGLIGDVGCFVFTHTGDGVYNARGVKRDGAIVAVRVNVSHDETYDYHEQPPPPQYKKDLEAKLASAEPAKPYAISENFKVGERVAHKKFGEGIVTRIVDAGKVEIAFAEGVKVLLQGQKR